MERGVRTGRCCGVARWSADMIRRVDAPLTDPAPGKIGELGRRAEGQTHLLRIEGAWADIGSLVFEDDGPTLDVGSDPSLPVPAGERSACRVGGNRDGM